MTKEAIVGKAVALARGHYRQANGMIVRVREGEVFNLVEGRETGTWFKRLPDAEPAQAEPVPVVAEKTARRGRPPKVDLVDDIA